MTITWAIRGCHFDIYDLKLDSFLHQRLCDPRTRVNGISWQVSTLGSTNVFHFFQWLLLVDNHT
jgi:hypothetical protein